MRWVVLFILAAILTILLYAITPIGSQWRIWTTQAITITSKASLVYISSNDSFAATQEGIRAARFVLDALKNKSTDSAKAASQIYDNLIPVENYGGEYTTLEWFCKYLLASDNEKKKFFSDKFAASFYDFFAENDYARLKEYLQRKYKLEQFVDQNTQAGQDRKAFLEDFILFNNPRREEWEKTSKIIGVLNLKQGDTIADVGSGPGYYTFKFSQLVGEKGRVFAIDTVKEHLNYVNSVSQKYGIQNVETIQTGGDAIGVKANQVNFAFLCSLYHNIYATAREEERNSFIESIKQALKKDGTLIVVDNALVKDSELPYHGPYIAKELIIGQLKYYGFHLVKDYAFIPQRYILVFNKD